ncbi:hypothetical protein STEG23_022598, partial [Scotinomys teguina]
MGNIDMTTAHIVSKQGHGSFFKKRTKAITLKSYVLLELELGITHQEFSAICTGFKSFLFLLELEIVTILIASSEPEKCGTLALKSQRPLTRFIQEIEHALGLGPAKQCPLREFLTMYIKTIFLNQVLAEINKEIEGVTKTADPLKVLANADTMKILGVQRPLLQ